MRFRLPSRFRFPLCGFVAAFTVLCHGVGLLSEGVAQEKQAAKKVDEKAELAEFLDDARNYAIRTTKPDVVLKLQLERVGIPSRRLRRPFSMPI